MKRKNYIDNMKCVALLMVFTVHFISLWGGWLHTPCKSSLRVLALGLYFLCNSCVPLFFMASGMLLNKRGFSLKRHYIKIVPILLMYLFASVICGLFKYFVEGESVGKLIKGVFTFSTAGYSWYVEYYILLFMLIPIINMLLNKLGNGKNLWIAILLMAAVSTAGSLYRYQDFVEESRIMTLCFKLLKNLFPILYYMIGFAINENRDQLKRLNYAWIWGILIIFLLSESLYYHFNYLNKSVPLVPNGYGMWNVTIVAGLFACVFVKKESDSKLIHNDIIIKISNSTLIAYLTSEIFDNIAFKIYGSGTPIPLYFGMPWLLFVAGCSIVVGVVGTNIIKPVGKAMIEMITSERGVNS